MSLDDFARCTPSEFYAAYEAWNDMRTRDERSRWERTRMQCLCALQPYSKRTLRAQDVMRFPWDGESEEGRVKSSGSEEGRVKIEEALSREEIMERYRKARERAGLK